MQKLHTNQNIKNKTNGIHSFSNFSKMLMFEIPKTCFWSFNAN